MCLILFQLLVKAGYPIHSDPLISQRKLKMFSNPELLEWMDKVNSWAVSHQNRSLELCHCHIKRRLGLAGTSRAFFWYDNDKDLKTRFFRNMAQMLNVK